MVSATPKLKNRGGRPATGRDPTTSIRLPAGMTEQLDAWAASQGISRSEAIRQLVVEALRRKQRNEPPRGNVQVADAGAAKRKSRA